MMRSVTIKKAKKELVLPSEGLMLRNLQTKGCGEGLSRFGLC